MISVAPPVLFTPPCLLAPVWDKAIIGVGRSMSGRLGTLPVYSLTKLKQLEARKNVSLKAELDKWDSGYDDMPIILDETRKRSVKNWPQLPSFYDAVAGIGYCGSIHKPECIVYDVTKALLIYTAKLLHARKENPEKAEERLQDEDFKQYALDGLENQFIFVDLGSHSPAWLYSDRHDIITVGERHE